MVTTEQRYKTPWKMMVCISAAQSARGTTQHQWVWLFQLYLFRLKTPERLNILTRYGEAHIPTDGITCAGIWESFVICCRKSSSQLGDNYLSFHPFCQNTKLNGMNMSQSLWVKDVAVRTLTAWHPLVREAGQATAFSHPAVPAPRATSKAGVYTSGRKTTFTWTDTAAGRKTWIQIFCVNLQACPVWRTQSWLAFTALLCSCREKALDPAQ